MKKTDLYTNAPSRIAKELLKAKPVLDFLPRPEELIYKEDIVKVTIHLNKQSVDFFKLKAKKCGIPYQRMIKRVIDLYANQYHQ